MTEEEFGTWVRDALKHLYDTAYLQNHPLVPMLLGADASEVVSTGQALREILLESIQALRPGPGTPAQSRDWRAYRVLELQYLEGLTRAEIMDELAVGKSQFFRDLARVLDLLVANLWRQHLAAGPAAPMGAPKHSDRRQWVKTEAERLAASAQWEMLNLEGVVRALEPLLLPYTESRGIRWRYRSAGSAPFVRADRVVLRQALLDLILYLVSSPQSRVIDAACVARQRAVELRLRTQAPGVAEGGPSPPARPQGVEICRQLMAAMEGEFRLEERGGWLEATLHWPSARSRLLLVIDDNAQLIDLYRRYLANEGWQIVGAGSGREACQVAREMEPAAILLDVMMPEEDGWEVLANLKRQADTRHVPVIICSVVDEPGLARSLGAAASLAKPVTQRVLLRTLRELDREGPSPSS